MYRLLMPFFGAGLLATVTLADLQRGHLGPLNTGGVGGADSVKVKRVSQCLHTARPGMTHGRPLPVGSLGFGIVDGSTVTMQSRQPQRVHSGPVTGSR